MNKTVAFGVALGLSLAVALPSATVAQESVESLRGAVPLAESDQAPQLKKWQRDRPPIPRDYVQQPPLVPHSIDDYKVTRANNKCMTCHAWSRYKETGATKISLTHFRDRDGNELANLAPRRYFCPQCHVPQVDAPPLVDNKFKPIDAMAPQ